MKKFILGSLLGGLLLSGGWFAWGAIQSEVGIDVATDPQPYGSGTSQSTWRKAFATAYTNTTGTVLQLWRRDTITPATHSALWAASSTGLCSGGETCFFPAYMAKAVGGNNDMPENGYIGVGMGVRNIDTNTAKLLTTQSTFGDGEIFGADSNANNSLTVIDLNYHKNGTVWDQVRGSFTQSTTGITGNGAGTTVTMTTTPMSKYTMIIDRTAGSTNVVEVDLQCSVNNTAFVQINTVTDLTNEPVLVATGDIPCNYLRYNVVTVGSGNTLAIDLLATR